jgi:hypothetical protein
LKRPDTDPLVIHTQTATEYWQRRGSLAHTDTRGNDLPQPPGVRIYMWASSQHFADPLLENPERGVCQNYRNTVATSMLFRAMIDAMDRWATSGIAPPDSRIPRRADGTLVPVEEWRRQFPTIPGVATPRAPSALPLLDFGPEAERGILKEPPDIVPRGEYVILVPAVDADGNDIAGIRAPMVAAPLGTWRMSSAQSRQQPIGVARAMTCAWDERMKILPSACPWSFDDICREDWYPTVPDPDNLKGSIQPR